MNDFTDSLNKPPKKKPGFGFQTPKPVAREAVDTAVKRPASERRVKFQLTTRLPRGTETAVMDELQRYATELNMYRNDVQVWALIRGIQALREGERPEPDTEDVKVSPKLPRWAK